LKPGDNTDPETLLRELAEQEAEADALAELADTLPVKAYAAKFAAIKARTDTINAKFDAATSTVAARWAGRAEKLRKRWSGMTADEQREIMLSVVGRV